MHRNEEIRVNDKWCVKNTETRCSFAIK